MANPDQIALLEQQLGRSLMPEEAQLLTQEMGLSSMPPAPPMSAPMPVLGPAPAPAPVVGRGGWEPGGGSHQNERAFDPGTNPHQNEVGFEPGAGHTLGAAQPAAALPARAPEPPDPSRFGPLQDETPQFDLSALEAAARGGGGGSGAGARYGQQARDARDALEGARNAQGEALRDVQAGVEKRAEQRVGTAVDREIEEQDIRERYRPQVDEAQDIVAQKMREHEEANRAAANTEITDRRSMKTKVMTGLAAGLGALAQAKMAYATGVNIGNPLADTVENAIQHDIEQQRADISNRRNTAEAKKGELAEAYARVGDVREAEAIATNALRDKYAAIAQELAAESGDAQQTADLEIGIQALNEKSAAERERLALAAQQRAQAAASAHNAQRQALAQQQLEAVKDYQRSQNMAGGLKVASADRFESLTGGDKKKAAEVVGDTVEKLEATNNIITIIDQMQDLRTQVAAGLPFSDAEARLESLQGQLVFGVKEAVKGGALDKGLVDLTERITGDTSSVTQLITGQAGAHLDAYAGQVALNNDAMLRNRGLSMRNDTSMGRVREATEDSRTRPLTAEDGP